MLANFLLLEQELTGSSQASSATVLERLLKNFLNEAFLKNAINITSIQSTCCENLKSCADKMVAQHIHKLGDAQVGDTVQIPVPDVDRGPNDLVHVLAYITKINKSHMTYQLATKHGIIQDMHSRNTFHIRTRTCTRIKHVQIINETFNTLF